MKSAMTVASKFHVPAWPRPATASLYKAAGVLIAVGVPTLFWTLVLVLATKGMGVEIGTPTMAVFGVIVAAWCLVGASLVMRNRD